MHTCIILQPFLYSHQLIGSFCVFFSCCKETDKKKNGLLPPKKHRLYLKQSFQMKVIQGTKDQATGPVFSGWSELSLLVKRQLGLYFEALMCHFSSRPEKEMIIGTRQTFSNYNASMAFQILVEGKLFSNAGSLVSYLDMC